MDADALIKYGVHSTPQAGNRQAKEWCNGDTALVAPSNPACRRQREIRRNYARCSLATYAKAQMAHRSKFGSDDGMGDSAVDTARNFDGMYLGGTPKTCKCIPLRESAARRLPRAEVWCRVESARQQ